MTSQGIHETLSVAPCQQHDSWRDDVSSQNVRQSEAMPATSNSPLLLCSTTFYDLYSLKESLNELLEFTAEVCQASIALVSLVETQQEWRNWIVDSKANTQRWLTLDLPFHRYTIQDTDVLAVPDVLADARFVNCPSLRSDFQIRFYAGVPLLSPEGCVLGVLGVIDDQPHQLHHYQIKALQTLGHQIVAQLSLWQSGVKIQHLSEQLYEVEFQQQQQTILFQLASQIRNSLDLNTILQTTVDQIHQLLHIDRCQFIWCLPTGSQFSFAVTHEAKVTNLPSLVMELPPEQATFLSTVIPSLKALRIEDISHTSELDCNIQELLIRAGITSQLLLPLKTQSGQLGAIVCSHYSARSWLDSEVKLLQAITDQLAIALEQAELFNQVNSNVLVARTQAQYLTEALQTLQQTQAQLIQHEKMSSLGQLVAGVAHEINNPVNFISGNIIHATNYVDDLLELLETYQAYYPHPETAVQEKADAIDLEFLREDLPKLLASMKMGAERIRQIVLSLRNFSRLDEAEIKPVDIHEGIDNTLLILQNRLKLTSSGCSISVVKEYSDLPLVECYAGQLNQVFMNLLGNAIDALDDVRNPSITITTHLLDCLPPGVRDVSGSSEIACTSTIAIFIRDNGCGMSETVQQKLFNPFFTTKPVGKGTGLGLSISYQIIVEKHGGVLRCTSDLGHGTEFQIYIPVRAALSIK